MFAKLRGLNQDDQINKFAGSYHATFEFCITTSNVGFEYIDI